MLKYMNENDLFVDPGIEDKKLEALLHEKWYEVERDLISEGHEILQFKTAETIEHYNSRVADYVKKVDDIKRSDLANYVSHRKVVLEILDKAIKLKSDGTYEREDVIHQLIVPMRKTSNEIRFDDCNLWLVNERLAFHNYLASDKPISSMSIVAEAKSGREPDICVLDVMDEPILVGEKSAPATLTIVELKRPMRADPSSKDENPIEQVFAYLRKIREGKVTTHEGRPIPNADKIPAFCYIIADLTDKMVEFCRDKDLKPTPDGMGYFGFHNTYNAYVEVMSFDSMLASAGERNRAFFDRLGLPTD